jgi:hypothetical protein
MTRTQNIIVTKKSILQDQKSLRVKTMLTFPYIREIIHYELHPPEQTLNQILVK